MADLLDDLKGLRRSKAEGHEKGIKEALREDSLRVRSSLTHEASPSSAAYRHQSPDGPTISATLNVKITPQPGAEADDAPKAPPPPAPAPSVRANTPGMDFYTGTRARGDVERMRVTLKGPYLTYQPVLGRGDDAHRGKECELLMVGASVQETADGDVAITPEKGPKLELKLSEVSASDVSPPYASLSTSLRLASRDCRTSDTAAAAAGGVSFPPTYLQSDLDIETLSLGQGSHGTVHRAVVKATGRKVAVKRTKSGALGHCELSLLMQMDSPFVLKAESCFEENGFLCIVMPLLEGGDLGLYLGCEKVLSLERVRFHAAEIVCGLDYLHSRNIVHRDLKPENAVLNAEGHVILTDMGCARTLLGSAKAQTFCGTEEYLAPEILDWSTGGHNHSVDWWGLGVMVYELLTGLLPFEGEGKELCDNIMRKAPVFPPEMNPDAEDLIRQLLRKNHVERPSSAEVKAHPFFASISWDLLKQRKLKPSFIPDPEQVEEFRKQLGC